MHPKISRIMLILLMSLFSIGELVAQGFGHQSAVGVVKRLKRIKNTARMSTKIPNYRYGTKPVELSNSYESLAQQMQRLDEQAKQMAQQAKLLSDGLENQAYVLSLRKKNKKNFVSQMPFLLSTFLAKSSDVVLRNFISGTLFKIMYNGQEEVFGVIPMHALGNSLERDFMIGHHFEANIFDPNRHHFVSIPGEVVQITAPELLDVALVKFNLQDIKMLRPLSLSQEMPALYSTVSSQGFAQDKAIFLPQREVKEAGPFAFKTTIPFPRDERRGLCGSSVINEKAELVGIHNGSSYRLEDEKYDTGYVTPSWIFERLVHAYHNNGVATIPIKIQEKTFVELNIDEYITKVTLLGLDNFVLEEYEVEHKFSQQTFEQLLQEHYPVFVDFTIRKVYWDESDKYVAGRHFDDIFKEYTYRYDMKQGIWFKKLPITPQKKKHFFEHVLGRKNKKFTKTIPHQ